MIKDLHGKTTSVLGRSSRDLRRVIRLDVKDGGRRRLDGILILEKALVFGKVLRDNTGLNVADGSIL